MKITHFASATELIEVNGKRIITDPWLCDGAFYGSWCHYPPVDLSSVPFDKIDYIYVSHIHPDHFDPATLALIPKSVPVLVHRYQRPFLRANIERLGFKVIELPHGEAFDIGNGAQITIFGADNCDPAICGRMFGCAPDEPRGTMQLDSLCVITSGKHTLVNTNDCPFEIAHTTLRDITKRYPVIDFALIGYSSASLYPHCMSDYDDEQLEKGKQVARRRGLISALQTLRTLKPRFFMPFAGTYVLGGALAAKTKKMPITELQDAVQFLEQDSQVAQSGSRAVLLNSGQFFDLASEQQSKPYVPVDRKEREKYVDTVLSSRELTYEQDALPQLSDFTDIADKCFSRFDARRREIGWSEEHGVYLSLPEHRLLRLPMNGERWSIEDKIRDENFSHFEMDHRLLLRAMHGPAMANWNNIEIGAHANLRRQPDQFNPQLHIALNSFHE